VSVFIIAEAGVNHNGSIELARKMVDTASKAGADAIKFQTFKAEKLVTRYAEKADYQRDASDENELQISMLKKLELNIEDHRKLISYCNEKKIIFMSTPFDIESIQLLIELGLKIFKIPSGEITNLPYLRCIGRLNKKIIISTGMSNMNEIKNALRVLIDSGTNKENITVLHANTQYPTPMKDVNLNAMINIGNTLNLKYGYSDHTLGIEVDIAAVAMGASCIEKHFTLDKNMEGPDHKASLEPEELKEMITAIRNIEDALGTSEKKLSNSEKSNITLIRKSIVASKKISKGEKFTKDNLDIKRPGNGISPMKWDEIIGTYATKDYSKDELI
tara:strand:+ start:2960 stop:3955 length:996 start_codon:yes stop_codon:yes gene_type:complete